MIRGAAYSPDRWHDYFIAIAGAAAALTGLVFVALSINLARILSFRWLPGRALETIAVLFEALVVATLCLVPQQRQAIGVELVAVGLAGWSIPLTIQLRVRPRMQDRDGLPFSVGEFVVRILVTQAATLPVIVAGASLVAAAGGGFYWLALGLVFLLLVGVVNAWVLLVEIVR